VTDTVGTTTCAGPGCTRPLAHPPTGRRRRYCGPNCKKAAARHKQYAARDAAERAEQLQAARAALAEMAPRLDKAAFTTVGDVATLVYVCGTDLSRPARELDKAIVMLREAAGQLEHLAREYRTASARAAELEARGE
jgi:hypothetical protein